MRQVTRICLTDVDCSAVNLHRDGTTGIPVPRLWAGSVCSVVTVINKLVTAVCQQASVERNRTSLMKRHAVFIARRVLVMISPLRTVVDWAAADRTNRNNPSLLALRRRAPSALASAPLRGDYHLPPLRPACTDIQAVQSRVPLVRSASSADDLPDLSSPAPADGFSSWSPGLGGSNKRWARLGWTWRGDAGGGRARFRCSPAVGSRGSSFVLHAQDAIGKFRIGYGL